MIFHKAFPWCSGSLNKFGSDVINSFSVILENTKPKNSNASKAAPAVTNKNALGEKNVPYTSLTAVFFRTAAASTAVPYRTYRKIRVGIAKTETARKKPDNPQSIFCIHCFLQGITINSVDNNSPPIANEL